MPAVVFRGLTACDSRLGLLKVAPRKSLKIGIWHWRQSAAVNLLAHLHRLQLDARDQIPDHHLTDLDVIFGN